jgi:hypothetical protein
LARISVAICTLGKIRIEHELGLLAQTWPLGHQREITVLKKYSIQNARNLAVYDAQKSKADFLLFYDDDMVPRSSDALMTLINTIDQNPKIDVLGAVYPRRTAIPEPVVAKTQGGGAFWDWEDGKIHKVWMVGTGFTIYRLSSLKKLIVPKDRVNIGDGHRVRCPRYFEINHSTDDFNFAALVAPIGLRQYVHGGVIVDQIGFEDGHRFMVEDARVRVEV